jgi:hypothetical protein
MRTSEAARRPSSSGSFLAFDLLGAARAASRSPPQSRDGITSTRARDSSAALSSNEGFSVVAPTSTTCRLHHGAGKLSCCCAVEAMHLVDEQQRALPHLAPRPCAASKAS